MGTFSHTFGAYNVEASLNYFLKQNLGTDVPAWMTWAYGSTPPRTLNFDYPEQPLTFPSFAVTHLGNEPSGPPFGGDKADGAYKGVPRSGLCEIDCWVTSKDNFNWMRDLRQMRDMVSLLFQKNRAITLYDFTTPTAPVAQTAVMRIVSVREVATAPDPNPAVKRKRMLVSYEWVERFT